jgi:predicted transcriptional regulator
MDIRSELLSMSSEIVAAYVSGNSLPPHEVPALLERVYRTLATLGLHNEPPMPSEFSPAISPKKSVTPEHIVCLEDGKKFKSLKRHLRTRYNMTPEEYRAKWGLPSDYPMVAPNYAKERSELAKRMGLGKAKAETSAPPTGRRRTSEGG